MSGEYTYFSKESLSLDKYLGETKTNHIDEIEFFRKLSCEIKVSNVVMEHDEDVVMMERCGEQTPVISLIRDKYKGMESSTRIKYMIMDPDNVINSIRLFCSNRPCVIDPADFINKWGLVHLSIMLNLNELFLKLLRVPGVDIDKRFCAGKEDQSYVTNSQIEEMHKSSTEVGLIKFNPTNSVFDRPDVTEVDMTDKKNNDLFVFNESVNMLKYYNPVDQIEKYCYNNCFGMEDTVYYPFVIGRWRTLMNTKYISPDKTRKRELNNDVFVKYQEDIFRNTSFIPYSVTQKIKKYDNMRRKMEFGTKDNDPMDVEDAELPVDPDIIRDEPWEVYPKWIFGATPLHFAYAFHGKGYYTNHLENNGANQMIRNVFGKELAFNLDGIEKREEEEAVGELEM